MFTAASIIGANEVGPTNKVRKNYQNQIYATNPSPATIYIYI
jgi:hypothetical protein